MRAWRIYEEDQAQTKLAIAMKTQHAVLREDPEFRRLLSVEALVAGASEVIARLMDEQKVSKADLARRLNKSRAWVTQLLSGKTNMTIRTLAELAHALGAEVRLQAQPLSWKANRALLRSHADVVAPRSSNEANRRRPAGRRAM